MKDLINILAILLSPIIAVWIGQILLERKEKKQLKLKIFATLMSTQAAPLTPSHIDALNLIRIAFSNNSKSDKTIRALWNAHFSHLRIKPNSEAEAIGWNATAATNLKILLQEMAHQLGYNSDELKLVETSYYPQYLVDVESEKDHLRRLWIECLSEGNALRTIIQKQPDTTTEP